MKLIDGIEWNPIAFVDDLVNAIQKDLKTETRRVIGGAPHSFYEGSALYDGRGVFESPSGTIVIKCPYGKPGGKLWVRERFACFEWAGVPCKISDADYVVFRDGFRKNVDGETYDNVYENKERLRRLPENTLWRPPMHLPFDFHRIELETKSIDVERVQDITEAGAVAEGFPYKPMPGLPSKYWESVQQFRDKWDVINGKRSDRKTGFEYTWENNPFVWPIKFKRIVDPK